MKIALSTLTACALAMCGTAAFAQATDGSASAPIVAVPKAAPVGEQTVLPTNTEVILSMNEELTTKGGKLEEGHKFGLSVAHDVRLRDHVVIPKGTPAFGEVTWKTGKAAFGKSGKMEVELRYIDLNGRRIPVSGKYRQEGEGNTVATVAAVATIWVAAPFITGKSARIPQGRELKAFTTEALPVVLPDAAPPPQPAAAPIVASPVATQE